MKENETKTQSKGTRVLKAIINTIINILIVLVLITSLLIAVMALTSKSSGISTIFGYTIQPIQSDSMKGGSPDGYGGKDFQKGDLMIAKATGFDDKAEYDMGDIITYRTEDTSGNPMLMSHRVVDVVTGRDGVTRYQTWGDNREMAQVPDQSDVNEYLVASDIGSLYYSKNYEGTILKGWGAPLDFIRTQQGFFFVVLLPMIIFFMYELIRVVMNAMNYKKAKSDEEKDEAVKAAVAAALSEQQANDNNASDPTKDLTPEQLEQIKKYMESQKQETDTDNSEKTEGSEDTENSEE